MRTPVVELQHYPVRLTPELLKASQRRTEASERASGENTIPPLELVPLSKENAEILLDWLEVEGYQGCEIRLKGGKGFTIRLDAHDIM